MKPSPVINKLDLYDTVSYVLVGFYAISISTLCYFFVFDYSLDIVKLAKAEIIFCVLLLSYFIGHITQAVGSGLFGFAANKPLLKKIFVQRNEFNEQEKKILNSFYEKQNLDQFYSEMSVEKRYSIIWGYCLMNAKKNDTTGEVVKFISYQTLFRSMTALHLLAFVVTIILYLSPFIYKTEVSQSNILIVILTNFLLFILFARRQAKFWNQIRYKVIQVNHLFKNVAEEQPDK